MAPALALFSTLDSVHTSASLTFNVAILRLTAGIIPHCSFRLTFSSVALDAEEGFATATTDDAGEDSQNCLIEDNIVVFKDLL